jgi:hypothetical protein
MRPYDQDMYDRALFNIRLHLRTMGKASLADVNLLAPAGEQPDADVVLDKIALYPNAAAQLAINRDRPLSNEQQRQCLNHVMAAVDASVFGRA